jgi:hypothetical protein
MMEVCGSVPPMEVDDVVKKELLLPSTLKAEKLLLGSVLREPLALLAARPLAPADFSNQAHALILTTLRQLEEDGLSIDLPTLTTRLERSGQLQRAGGAAYLAELVRAAPAGISVQRAAELARHIQAGRAAPMSADAGGEENTPAGSQRYKQRVSVGSTGILPALSDADTHAGMASSHVAPPSLAASSRAGTEADASDQARVRVSPAAPASPPTVQAPTIQRIDALLSQEFAPTRWIVPDLLPEGLTLLAAKPKLGKSRLALGLALAVAAGGTALGEIEVEPGAVLYLALEDSLKRLRERTQKLLGEQAAPPALEVATAWPRLDDGGLDQLERWLSEHPDARLIILDTLAKIRGTRSIGSYAGDYASLEGAQALAHQAGVGILVIHHTVKESRQDALDEVNATQGLAGVADNILVLRGPRGQAEAQLFGDGRELNKIERWLRSDPESGAWSLCDPPEAQAKTPERTDILRVLKASPEPMTPTQIGENLGKSTGAIRKLLMRMLRDGDVITPGWGKYRPVLDSGNDGNNGND